MMNGKSFDLKQGKIERLKEVIPEAFTGESRGYSIGLLVYGLFSV